jgi:HSP20 family protein
MNLRSLIPVNRSRGVARREPADPFTSLQREIDRLFDDFTRALPAPTFTASELTPSIDVTETDKQFEITAELPGLEEKDVQVNVADNVLTIQGEKKAAKEEKDKSYRIFERRYGSFMRSLELPNGVDADAIKATLTNGVLNVIIPKTPAAQVKKVEVKSAA